MACARGAALLTARSAFPTPQVYLIDKLALRVGNEKNTDEEADTVGCCSLRVEHVKLDAGENQLHLNFLGKVTPPQRSPLTHRPPLTFTPHRRPVNEAHPSQPLPHHQDSIVYDNTTPVIPEAFTLIQKFLANKKGSDQVFDHVQPEVRTGTRLGHGAAPRTRAAPHRSPPAPPSTL